MRLTETVMPEGMGVWYLRYVDDQTIVPDRGPFIAHKSALKAMRQVNGEADTLAPVEQAPAIEPLGPEGSARFPKIGEEIAEVNRRLDKASKPKAPKAKGKEETAKQVARELVKVAEAISTPDSPATSAARHAWIEEAAEFALTIVAKAGGKVHDRIRVTIGWPVGLRGGKVLGQCWSELASADGVREVFISPALSDGSRIVDVLIHELCHACLPHEVKHGKEFKQLAQACGLEGKMTATTASEELQALIASDFLAEHGPYPAGAVDPAASGRKKQSTRLIKAECPECGYVVRTTRKWIAVAHPHCPDVNCAGHDMPMDIDGEDGGDGEGEE